MKRPRLSIATLATIALLGTFGAGSVLAANATIPLHNNSAQVGTPDQCPRPPLGAARTGISWSTRITGPSLSYVPSQRRWDHLRPRIDSERLAADNVFVAVPAGNTLGDLLNAGSIADVKYPDGTTAPTRFVPPEPSVPR